MNAKLRVHKKVSELFHSRGVRAAALRPIASTLSVTKLLNYLRSPVYLRFFPFSFLVFDARIQFFFFLIFRSVPLGFAHFCSAIIFFFCFKLWNANTNFARAVKICDRRVLKLFTNWTAVCAANEAHDVVAAHIFHSRRASSEWDLHSYCWDRVRFALRASTSLDCEFRQCNGRNTYLSSTQWPNRQIHAFWVNSFECFSMECWANMCCVRSCAPGRFKLICISARTVRLINI